MNTEVYFKALHKKKKFRNSKSGICYRDFEDEFLQITKEELIEAELYITQLIQQNIQYTYIGHANYPSSFYKINEPPYFLEYIGEPIWLNNNCFSVVGSRQMSPLTNKWFEHTFEGFLKCQSLIVVSGGAEGVDQKAHLSAVKMQTPTIVVLPCGVNQLFPQNLNYLKNIILQNKGVFISEFESQTPARKSHFYFRNRLISGFSKVLLVAQAEIKSGTFLTVHHALQNGKLVLTIPAHPELTGFSGNLKLIEDGACSVATKDDLINYWNSEQNENLSLFM